MGGPPGDEARIRMPPCRAPVFRHPRVGPIILANAVHPHSAHATLRSRQACGSSCLTYSAITSARSHEHSSGIARRKTVRPVSGRRHDSNPGRASQGVRSSTSMPCGWRWLATSCVNASRCCTWAIGAFPFARFQPDRTGGRSTERLRKHDSRIYTSFWATRHHRAVEFMYGHHMELVASANARLLTLVRTTHG